MKGLKQFSIVLLILALGEILQLKFNIPVPGTILGMVILLFLLLLRIIKLKTIENISNVLLEHLALYFVPVNVGVIVYYDNIKSQLLKLFIVLIVSTIVVMAVTGLTVQLLDKAIRKQKKGEKHESLF